MTITPEEAQKTTDADRSEIQQLEKRIDAHLRENFQGRGSVSSSINESIPHRVLTEIKNPNHSRAVGIFKPQIVTDAAAELRGFKPNLSIKRMYGGAGWSVSYQSDQREGDWLEFSPKPGGYHDYR